MSESVRHFLAGLFVLGGFIALAWLSLSIAGMSYGGPGGFSLYAEFQEIGGLQERAQVTIAGVKVGEVKSISLTEDFEARVELDLRPGLKLPSDTTAEIMTAGVLGERYIVLLPGGVDDELKAGEEIYMTSPAMILERVIGGLIQGSDLGDP